MSVGTYANFVDTQDVVVTNITDALTYTQAQTILPFGVSHEMVEHHTTTEYVEKLSSLDMVSVPIAMILTEPELLALINLSIVVNCKLPIKQWRVTFNSFSNNSTKIEGWAKVFDFNILDKGDDILTISFTLEFESKMAAVADKDVIEPT